jgi:multimeric flavodoxin WrbA
LVAFTNSANVNGDKHSTLHYFMTLAMQHGGLWAGTGLNYNNTKASQRSDVNYLASSAGPMAQTPGDASGEEMNAGRSGDRPVVWRSVLPGSRPRTHPLSPPQPS